MSQNVSLAIAGTIPGMLCHVASRLKVVDKLFFSFLYVLFLAFPPVTSAKDAAVPLAELQMLQGQAELDAQVFLHALRPELRTKLREATEALVARRLAAPSMARRLAGSDNWQPLELSQKDTLSQEMARTVSRYLLEVAELYSEQTVSIAGLVASSANRVQMQILVHGVPGREKVPVMLDWVRTEQGWRIADFSVEGISYTLTKRWQYQVLWQQGGYERYQQHLKAKNDEFFSAWLAQPHVKEMSASNPSGSPN